MFARAPNTNVHAGFESSCANVKNHKIDMAHMINYKINRNHETLDALIKSATLSDR